LDPQWTASPRSTEPSTREVYYPVLEASPNAVVAVDELARITYANPQVEATFGYAPAELLGQAVEMLLPERVSSLHVAHRDGFLAHPVARPMGIGLDLAGAGTARSSPSRSVSRRSTPPKAAASSRRSSTSPPASRWRASSSQLLRAVQGAKSTSRTAG
jgi:hypothetical protein